MGKQFAANWGFAARNIALKGRGGALGMCGIAAPRLAALPMCLRGSLQQQPKKSETVAIPKADSLFWAIY